MIYERLDKLRTEVERIKRKLENDKEKLREAEQRLKEAENSQILADVGAMKLTPEQLAEFLKLVAEGKTQASLEKRVNDDEEENKESEENEDEE